MKRSIHVMVEEGLLEELKKRCPRRGQLTWEVEDAIRAHIEKMKRDEEERRAIEEEIKRMRKKAGGSEDGDRQQCEGDVPSVS